MAVSNFAEWTCCCGAWNEHHRTHCAECGVNRNEAERIKNEPANDTSIVEIMAAIRGYHLPAMPDDIAADGWGGGAWQHTPFDEFPNDEGA